MPQIPFLLIHIMQIKVLITTTWKMYINSAFFAHFFKQRKTPGAHFVLKYHYKYFELINAFDFALNG